MAPKQEIGFIKLQIPAGQANPAPPVGPALGQHGVNIMDFCKAFNDKTKDQMVLSLIHIRRCLLSTQSRTRSSPYH